MVERDLRRYFKTKEEPTPSQIQDISEEVASGTGLEQGIGYKTSPEVLDEIIREIAVSTYYSSDFLSNTPWPNFGLIYDWGGKPSRRHKNSNRIVLAEASIDVKNPYGLISFSPEYLSSIADFMMGRYTYDSLTLNAEHPLPKTTAHENYHIFQYFNFPKTMEKYVEVAASEGLSKWEKTRAERSARIFEDVFQSASTCLYGGEHAWDSNAKIYIPK
ncbi:MAG TPA: hypothetical protein VES68_02305 [Candidatus Sulfotelmatobacter sp.]|nr:hypothetical protein [Candidatus Sulfotelmatobacter sp.]